MCRSLPSGRTRYLEYHTTPQVIIGWVEVTRGAQIAERLLFRSSKYRPSVSFFATYVLNYYWFLRRATGDHRNRPRKCRHDVSNISSHRRRPNFALVALNSQRSILSGTVVEVFVTSSAPFSISRYRPYLGQKKHKNSGVFCQGRAPLIS